MDRPFHFKKFSVLHHQSTMRVGTDAVLLGAWVNCSKAERILDIGAGSGILSLMLAQRNPLASITAVDIDQPSANEANINFLSSRWRNRLKAVCADIRLYDQQNDNRFELIISNPPFFTSSFKTQKARRNLARHTDTLSYHELALAAARLMGEKAIFAVVLPADSFNYMMEAALGQSLHLQRILHIIPVNGMAPNRINAEFGFEKNTGPNSESLTIRNSDYSFSSDYKILLQDFYLGIVL